MYENTRRKSWSWNTIFDASENTAVWHMQNEKYAIYSTHLWPNWKKIGV